MDWTTTTRQAAQVTAVISTRVLHSDTLMSQVRERVPELLYKYFQFPDYWPYERPPRKGAAEDGVSHVNELIDLMFEGGSHVVNLATDHIKSLSSQFFFPILSLMEDPDEAHILIGSNLNDSKRRLQMIQRELETNMALVNDYPWLKKPVNAKQQGIAWSRTELTVDGRTQNRPNPSVYACAVGSNDIRGRRGKLLMDDVEGEDARHYAAKRRALYDFIKLEAIRCLESSHESNRPLLMALGTPFDSDSIYFRLEREGWQVLRYPAYTVDWSKVCEYSKKQDQWARIPDSYFLWPQKRDKVLSQDPHFGRGMTKDQFAIAYLLDPFLANPGRLSLSDIERLTGEAPFTEQDGWTTYVSLDTASGSETARADYAGISVCQIRWPKGEELPQVQVLSCFKFTQGLFEQVHLCAELAAQFGCPVIVEANFGGSTYRNAFIHLHPEVKLIEVYTTRDKKLDEKMGLTVVRTLVNRSRLRVPQSQLESDGIKAFQMEITELGSDRYHDHIACSVWFVVRYCFDQVRMMSQTIQPYSGGRSGWGGSGGWRAYRR